MNTIRSFVADRKLEEAKQKHDKHLQQIEGFVSKIIALQVRNRHDDAMLFTEILQKMIDKMREAKNG